MADASFLASAAVCILWGVLGYAFFLIWKASLFVMDAYVAVVLMVSTVITFSL